MLNSFDPGVWNTDRRDERIVVHETVQNPLILAIRVLIFDVQHVPDQYSFVVVKDMLNKQHHPAEISGRGAENFTIVIIFSASRRLGGINNCSTSC